MIKIKKRGRPSDSPCKVPGVNGMKFGLEEFCPCWGWVRAGCCDRVSDHKSSRRFRTEYGEECSPSPRPSPARERIPPTFDLVLLPPEPRKEMAFRDLDHALDLDRFPDFSRPGFMGRESFRPRGGIAGAPDWRGVSRRRAPRPWSEEHRSSNRGGSWRFPRRPQERELNVAFGVVAPGTREGRGTNKIMIKSKKRGRPLDGPRKVRMDKKILYQ